MLTMTLILQEIQADKRNSYPMAKQQEQQLQASNNRQNQESPKKGPQQSQRKETHQSPRKEIKVKISSHKSIEGKEGPLFRQYKPHP